MDDSEYLAKRGKIVRTDFVQEIDEHWSKKILVKNILIFE